MSDFFSAKIISDFLRSQEEVFTLDEFYKELKSNGIKINKNQVEDILHSTEFVFPLVNHQFITRAGVFLGRWFSFKPSKEEVDKGCFIIGHRCMPFVNPEIPPDSINVVVNGKIIESTSQKFSMNLALDTYALYGEGYVLPYIINDKSNKSVPLTAIQYNLPNEIALTCWPLNSLTNGLSFRYGDRVLCRVTDWNSCTVEMILQRTEIAENVISSSEIERENWYKSFEEGILASFDKNGPGSSIEEQLAFLFLEHQEELCTKNCGSIEEFVRHTKKIGFSHYGVESRIWKADQEVPYVGEWNKYVSKELLLTEMTTLFSVEIIDAFLENNIYSKKNKTPEELSYDIFPTELKIPSPQRKVMIMNIERRQAMVEKEYSMFTDYGINPMRKRIIKFFSQIIKILGAIGASGIDVEKFPQQEIIVLVQLYTHVVRLVEELQNPYLKSEIPLEEMSLSLDGMEDTFDEIYDTLKSALDRNIKNGFEIVK